MIEVKNKYVIYSIIILILLATFLFVYNMNKKTNIKSTDEIILDTNGGVPFTWQCEIEDETIAKIKEIEEENVSKGNLAGGAIKLHYVIKGVSKGTTTIKCEYINFIYNEVSETKKYNIIVDDELNVKIN